MTGTRVRALSPTMALALWLLWLPNDDQIWRLLANNSRQLWRAAAWPTTTTYAALRDRELIDRNRCLTDAGLDWIARQIEVAWDRATDRDELIEDGLAHGYIVKAGR
jgi:hypothetical protein